MKVKELIERLKENDLKTTKTKTINRRRCSLVVHPQQTRNVQSHP